MPCCATGSARRVVSGAAVAGCVLGGFADGVTGALIRVAEVGTRGGCWPGCFDQGLLGRRRRRRRRLRCGWSRARLVGGGLRCRRRGAGASALRIASQLLQRLLIELLGGALLRYGLGFRREPGQVLGRVEEGQLLVALLENVDGADQARLMEEDARAIEQEPDDPQINDDGDVDGLAEACFGAFVVERVEQMDQLMLFEFAIAAGTHLDGLGGRRGVGRSLEGGHGLCGLTGAGCESFVYKQAVNFRLNAPVCIDPSIFSFLRLLRVKEAICAKFLKPKDETRRLGGVTQNFSSDVRAVVLTISDRCSRGEQVDLSGPAVRQLLEAAGVSVVAAEMSAR